MKASFIIVKKELLQIFRDKSTVIFLILPILIFPLFNIGLDFISKDHHNEVTICTYNDNENIECFLEQFIKSTNEYVIKKVDSDCPLDLLKKGEIDCYIKIQGSEFNFIYNSSSYNSLSITTKLGESIQRNYYSYLSNNIEEIYQFNLKNEKGNSSNISISISNIFIPIILVILVFQGVTNFSNDLFAGEKERKTFELMLLSNINRKTVYFGKVISLVVMSFINTVISLIAFLISNVISDNEIQQFEFMNSKEQTINILVMILMLLVLSVVAVVITSSVSLFSKNIKSSQILNELILLVPIGVTVMHCLGIFNMNSRIISIIPILNIVDVFNNAFKGVVNMVNIIFTTFTTLIFILIITIFCVKHINSEKCLF